MAQFNFHTAEQLYRDMELYLIANPTPNGAWNLNIGSRMKTLLEGISLVLSSTSMDFYFDLKKVLFSSVMDSFDFQKLPGTKATGYLKFTRYTDAATVSIPSGTKVISNRGIMFKTIAAGQITLGNLESSQIASEAVEVGTTGNILINDIDTLNGEGNIVDVIDGVDNCINDAAFANGGDEETDLQQIQRFRDTISGLTTSTKYGLEKVVKEIAGVKNVSVLENYPEKGVNTIIVDDGTGLLPPLLKAEIEKVINGDPLDLIHYPGKRAGGIEIIVQAPIIQVINMTLSVYKPANSLINSTDLANLVKSIIEQYINSRKSGESIVITEINTIIQNCNTEIVDTQITASSPVIETLTNGMVQITISPQKTAKTGTGVGGTITVNIVNI